MQSMSVKISVLLADLFFFLFRNGDCTCTYTYAVRSIKFFFLVLGIYIFLCGGFFYFFFSRMQVWMLRLVCLAWSFILLTASPFFVHQGPRWKITVEIWNLTILGDRKSSLRQIVAWFNCPRSFLCLFAFPFLICFSLWELFPVIIAL